ncbi:porin family protein [Epilithonimonas zeae]|uniref:Outer membrane protein beta-barrel domain-containing protein n=1 Tax=Epilithonimonas zeae TaxID=1416779 RepID=A0A1N6J584_9FLAO|nr:porin family protein [Epilithonimonas zeae]SIO39276.1 Outer membrane protein beta-barrel domain-containing protein [Epilithonimonas zeae]
MKKIVIIYALVLFGFANAQSVKYGLTGNIHKSSIVGIHDRSKGIFGGNVGVFADFSLVTNDIYDSAWLYFTPQLEFAMFGENSKYPNKDLQKFHNNYISMPLFIKYFIKNHGYKSDIYLMAGPKLEYLITDKVSGPASLTADQEKNLNKFAYGLAVAVGVKVQENWDVFIRFDRGFSKIYPDYTKYTTYNRMLGIGINYYLGSTN